MLLLLSATAAPADERPRPELPVAARWSYADAGAGLPHAGQWRDGFAVADVDGDGSPDIVHGPARKRPGPPVIFRRDGRGGWRAWDAARFPSLPYDYGDVAVADFDADGIADLVLGVHLRGVFALRGTRDGGFTDASRGLGDVGSATRLASHAVAVADWDGDGRPDVLALSEGLRPSGGTPGAPARISGLSVFRNLGADGWQPLPAAPGGGGPAGSALAVADLDGDGRPDAITGTDELGRRDLHYAPDASGTVRASTLAALPASTLVRGVAIADLDGDGHADVVVAGLTRDDAGWYGRLDVLWATPAGSWEDTPLAVLPGRAGVDAVATGDTDGDGHRDVVALTGDGRVLVFAGAAERRFTVESAPVPPWTDRCAGSHVILADLDGDRHDEIVASFAEEHDDVGGTHRCENGGGIAVWKVSTGG